MSSHLTDLMPNGHLPSWVAYCSVCAWRQYRPSERAPTAEERRGWRGAGTIAGRAHFSQWRPLARAISTNLQVTSWDHYGYKYSIIYLMRIEDIRGWISISPWMSAG